MKTIIAFSIGMISICFAQQDITMKVNKDNFNNLINMKWNLKAVELIDTVLIKIEEKLSDPSCSMAGYPLQLNFTNSDILNEVHMTISPTIIYHCGGMYGPLLITFDLIMHFEGVLYYNTNTKSIELKNAVATVYPSSTNFLGDLAFSILALYFGFDATVTQEMNTSLMNLQLPGHIVNKLTYNPGTNDIPANIEIGLTNQIPSISVSSNYPSYGTTIPPAGSYYSSSPFRVQAYRIGSNQFNNWSLNGANVGGTNPYTVTMNGNKTMVANFSTKYIAEKRKFIPDEYVVEQNHPNPFNPSTEIQYGVPEPSYVRISIYDVMGRELFTRSIGNVAAGYYRFVVNDTDIDGLRSSGVMIYRVDIQGPNNQNYSFVKRMMYLK